MEEDGGGRKRKAVRFDDEVEEREMEDEVALALSRAKRARPDGGDDDDDEPQSKHTLDSDEEEEEKYERLNMGSVRGQEAATQDFDGDTKITPFNMREELEDGHFDAQGNFIFDKAAGDELKDAWLDGIDWAHAKQRAGEHWRPDAVDDDDAAAADAADDGAAPAAMSAAERARTLTAILGFVRPGESAQKALRRLGGAVDPAEARRHLWRKDGAAGAAAGDVAELTGLLDQLVSDGDFDVYEYTHAKIKHELSSGASTSADGAASAASDSSTPTTAAGGEGADASDEIKWVFRWRNDDNAELYGPFGSSQMLQWAESSYFEPAVWVRRHDKPDGEFHSSSRIDFDLFT